MVLATMDNNCLEALSYYGLQSGDILSLLFLIHVFLPEGGSLSWFLKESQDDFSEFLYFI